MNLSFGSTKIQVRLLFGGCSVTQLYKLPIVARTISMVVLAEASGLITNVSPFTKHCMVSRSLTGH